MKLKFRPNHGPSPMVVPPRYGVLLNSAQSWSQPNGGITTLPQGSPISPILFLIYIRDLFQNLEDVYPLSYIDDIALATSSTSWKKNTRIFQREVEKLTRTGESQAIQFDLAKMELLHFSKSAKAKSAMITLLTKEIILPAQNAVRWLTSW
jgi:hypothetical protein